MKLKSTTPINNNTNIKILLRCLNLDENNSTFIKYTKEQYFNAEIDNCHVNNMIKQKLCGGDIVFGWIIWEDKEVNFVEACFHSLWKDNQGNLFDITPRKDGEQIILFVQDNTRTITLLYDKNLPAIKTFDNFRIINSNIINGVEEIVVIIKSDLIYEHGLAMKS